METVVIERTGAPEGSSPEAPYGYKADGTPRRSAGGRPKGSTPRAKSAPGPASPAPPRARAPRPPKTANYALMATGMIQLLAMPMRYVLPPLDVATVLIHAPALGMAVQHTAEQDARVAALCDKLLQVGPYGELITVVGTIGLQIAVNHGKARAADLAELGVVEPAELAARLGGAVQAAEQQAREAEAEQARRDAAA